VAKGPRNNKETKETNRNECLLNNVTKCDRISKRDRNNEIQGQPCWLFYRGVGDVFTISEE